MTLTDYIHSPFRNVVISITAAPLEPPQGRLIFGICYGIRPDGDGRPPGRPGAWVIVALALFVIVALFTLGGAVGVVATRNVVHAALFLLLSLLGAAGVYLLLFAEFLALVQVLIYGGAVTIVVLFAVMLTRSSEYPRITDNRQWPLAILAALAVSGILGAAFWLAPARAVVSQPQGPQAPEFTGLAASLFTKWALPFEIASLVLLVALIGAIIIARQQSVGVSDGGAPASDGGD